MTSHGSTYVGTFDSSMNHISNSTLSNPPIPSLSTSATDTSNLSANTNTTTVTSGSPPLFANPNSSASTITTIPPIKQPFPQYYAGQQPAQQHQSLQHQPLQPQIQSQQHFTQGQYQIQAQPIALQQHQQPTQYYTQDYSTIDPYYQAQQYNNQYYYTNGIATSAVPYQYPQSFVPLQYGAYAQLASSTRGQAHPQVTSLPLPSQHQSQVQQYYYDPTVAATVATATTAATAAVTNAPTTTAAAATSSSIPPISNFITGAGSTITTALDNGIKDSNNNSHNNSNNNNNNNDSNSSNSSSNNNSNNNNVVSLITPSIAPIISTSNNNSGNVVTVSDGASTTIGAASIINSTTTTNNNNNISTSANTGNNTSNSNTNSNTNSNSSSSNNSNGGGNGYVQEEYTQLAPLPQLQAISPHLPVPFASHQQQQQQQTPQQRQLQTQSPFQLQPPIQTQPLQPTILPTIKPPVPSYRTVPHTNFGVITTMWEDENTLCYQVEANGVNVVRRADNNFINGTKLLNVTRMTRGRRDGILKAEKVRHVVKIGSMHLKGVWIPFERAQIMAQRENILDLLYPLFVPDIESLLSGN
ncbi:hypothetical protein RI543_000444 [Arxiozyma heterogenica]|uniref:HTH APSES-type domain-containing protein n=1 Tax=Arxiozyma heterogenica TaxID=278026 RepID=A0AAN7W660_9SACH|nr:hypothetical protein RI543_000444 [Kazachstania heterogenica]